MSVSTATDTAATPNRLSQGRLVIMLNGEEAPADGRGLTIWRTQGRAPRAVPAIHFDVSRIPETWNCFLTPCLSPLNSSHEF